MVQFRRPLEKMLQTYKGYLYYLILFFFFQFRLVGDVLVATAFLSYSGPFNQDFRLVLNKNWMKEMKNRKIPFTANLNLIDMLVEPTTVR